MNKHKKALLTFDIEEFVTPKEQGMNISEKILDTISIEGFKKILKLIQENNIHTTLFVTSSFGTKKKVVHLIQKCLDVGCELALHGKNHDEVYARMNVAHIKKTLTEAKQMLEDCFSVPIQGFRSPRLQHVPIEIIKKVGLLYMASLHPTYIPGHYNYFFTTRSICYKKGVISIPISVTPLLRLPFSWFWFRTLGLTYAKMCTRATFFDQDYVQLYFHPWDFSDIISRVQSPSGSLTREMIGLKSYLLMRKTYCFSDMMQSYIYWLQENDVRFQTVGKYLDDWKSAKAF